MKRNILLTVLVVAGFGCQSSLVEREMHSAYDVPDVPELPAQEETGLPIVGFSAQGEIVVFDGLTGEIASLEKGGGGTPRDVAMDPWRKGAWVFEENEDASGGEIRFCPLEKGFGAAGQKLTWQLRPCEHAVWIDGTAALMPTEDGLWVFEDGIGGARWKVLRLGQATSSVSAPRPASIWMEDGEIGALTFGFQNDRLQMFRADMGENGPAVVQESDWGQPLGYPPTARYAWLSWDSGLLFDAVGDMLTVRRALGGEIGLPMPIDVGITVPRIEAAVGVGTSALVLGRDALWIVAARDNDVELMTGLWLHGDVRESSLFFSRDLLVTPERAFVGTDRGIRAIVMEKDGDAVVNAYLDEQFVGEGFRGPVDAVRVIGP